MLGTLEFAGVWIPAHAGRVRDAKALLCPSLHHLKHQIRTDPLLTKLNKVLNALRDIEHLSERLFAIWRVERGLRR